MWFALMMCIIFPAGHDSLIAAEASDVASGLSLRVEIDRQEFLPGEPVVVGLSVENNGSEPFEDLSTLNPGQEFISFSLTRDGKPLRWTGRQETWLFTKEGTRLEAGARLCDVFDLLEYFGARSTISRGEGLFSLRRSLAPGSYSLATRFLARIGIRKDLPQIVIDGNEIRFVVRDASAIPASENGALALLAESSDRDLAHRSFNRPMDTQVRGMNQSRYFGSLVHAFPFADSVNMVAIATEYLSRGGGKLVAARMLREKFKRFGYRLNASAAWLGSAAREDTKGSFTCFIRMWEEGIAQGRKYGRGED